MLAQADLYRRTILEQHGAAVLEQCDAEFALSHSARLAPEYKADWYCRRLSVLTGWTPLETFKRMEMRRAQPSTAGGGV